MIYPPVLQADDDVASPGLGVSWYSAKNGLDGLENGGLPVRGLAQPAASAASVDGGATWAQTSLYGGILVMGAKIRCSPTPSPTASSSQSATGSQLQSPSQSSSPSSSGSRSNSASAAATASQTSSESATASLTASLSGSSSSTPSPTVSASETGTSSCSSTLSPSTSGTASQSATLTISASISVTPSSTSTRSATGSGTTSSTPSSTLSPSSRRTFSTTRTPSRTGPVSLTSSPTQLSASSTGTVSAFPSDSGTSSEIPTPSSTISATLSISQSRTVSGSRTLSLSPSHSITVLLAADNCTPDSNSINCSAFGGAASGALSGSSLPSTAVVTGAAIGGLFLLLLVVLLVLMLLCIFRRQKEQTATAAAETDVAGIAAPKSHPGASTAGVVSSWMQSPAVTAPIQPIATPVLRDAAASVDAVPCAESPKATYVAAGTVPAGQTPASKANASGAPVNVTSDAPPVALVVESPVRVGVQSQSIARDQATDNVSAATAFATRERNTPRTAIESGVRGPGRAKGHLRGDTGIAQASAVAIEAVVHVSTSGVAIATPHVGSAVDNGHAGVKVVAAPPLVAGSAVVDGVPPTAVAVAVAIPVQVVAADPTTADAVLEAIPAPNTQPVAADSIGTHLSAPAALSGVPPIKPAAVVTSRVGPVGVIVVAPDVTAAVFAAPRGADAASAPRRIDVSSRRRVTAAPKQAIRDRPRASPSTRGMSTSRLNERMVAGSSSTKLHSESTAPADATGESLRPDSIVRPAISTTSIVNVTAPVCQRPSAEASSPPSRIAPSQMGSSSHVVSAAPPALDGSGPRDCNAVSVAASVIATPPSADDSPPASAASPAQGEGACILEVASGCDDGGSAGSVSREQPQTSRGLPHQETPQSGTLSSRPSGAATAATERTMPGWASRVRSLQARLRDDKPSRGLVEGSALPSSRYLSPASSSHASAEAAAAALLFDSTASPSGSRTLRMQRGDGSGGVDSEPGIGGTGGRGDALSLPSDSIAAPHGTSSGLPGLARSRTAASPLSPASVRPENTIAYLAGSADVDLPGSASVSSPFQPNSSSSTPAEGAPPPRSLLARSGSSVSVRGRGMLVAFPDSDRRRPPGSVNSRVSPSAQLSPLRSRSPEARRLPHTRSSPPATSPTSKSQFVIVRSGLLLRKPESGQPPDPV